MDQAELVAKLLAGEVTGIEPIEAHIETHLSHVFLTKDRAYKLKRAIKLPFVDFSTPEQRRLACLAEVNINESFGCPLMMGAIPICRSPEGRYWVGLEAEVVDYLVLTHRFDRGGQFDELAQTGQLTLDHVRRIADLAAEMHLGAASSARLGHIADYRHILAGLQRTEIHGAVQLGLRPAESDIYDGVEQALTRVEPLIERRRRAGKVRRTHGDLHLRNLCLYKGEPTIFDALEFEPGLATTDVVFDVSFLLMDLQSRGLTGHANAVMNRYWDSAGEDEDALGLLTAFTALRSLTRRAVALERGDLEEAERYRLLAARLVHGQPAQHIAIGGLSGSGKSTIARLLAPHMSGPAGARLLRTDALRDRRISHGARYATSTRERVYEDLSARFRQASDAGASVIADATFSEPEFATRFFGRAGQGVKRFWLRASERQRVERVRMRWGDPSEITPEAARAQTEPPGLSRDWTVIDADLPAEEVMRAVLKEMAHEVHAA